MLLLIDFDKTLTQHATLRTIKQGDSSLTTNYYYSQPEQIQSNLNLPLLAARTLRQCQKEGHIICILSNNANSELIERYLACLLGQDWQDVISRLICGNNQLTIKAPTAARLAAHYNISLASTLLVDDNHDQCRAMTEYGMVGLLATANGAHWGKLSSFCLRESYSHNPSGLFNPPRLDRQRSISGQCDYGRSFTQKASFV